MVPTYTLDMGRCVHANMNTVNSTLPERYGGRRALKTIVVLVFLIDPPGEAIFWGAEREENRRGGDVINGGERRSL